MYKLTVVNECECFKLSGLKNQQFFELLDNVTKEAITLKNRMNSEFCSKHNFEIKKIFNNFIITFSEEEPKSLKCCGSGCCK